MDFVIVLGIVGSIASIVGLFLPAQSTQQRTIHVIYGLGVFIVASSAVYYQQQLSSVNEKLSRVNSVEIAAKTLVKEENQYTSLGFIQASLAFLEKNKDLYPDSYARAQEICKMSQCLGSIEGIEWDSAKTLNYKYLIIDASYAMKGLLRGISEISKDKNKVCD